MSKQFDLESLSPELRAQVEAEQAKATKAGLSKELQKALKGPARFILDGEAMQPPKLEPGATVHIRNTFGMRVSGTIICEPAPFRWVVEANGRRLVVFHWEDAWE